MKKIIILMIVMLFFINGCGKYSENDVIKDLENKINKLNAYKLSGELEIINNDDVYNYDVEVSYKEKKFYKVTITNVDNNHTQVILKNNDGVYVMTHKSTQLL